MKIAPWEARAYLNHDAFPKFLREVARDVVFQVVDEWRVGVVREDRLRRR